MPQPSLHPAHAIADGQKRIRFCVALGITILLLLCGCHHTGRVETKIVALIHECPAITTCQISLRSATSFDFDSMYAFDDNSDAQDRARILRIKDEGFEEMTRQLVFLKAGKIVHQENEPTNFEGIVKNQVVFDSADRQNFEVFSCDAVFSVIAEESNGERYFVRKQIKSGKNP